MNEVQGVTATRWHPAVREGLLNLPWPSLLRIGICLLALLVTALTWVLWTPPALSGPDELLLLFLAAAVAASHRLPIRVKKGAGIYFSSVPLYLLSCIFAPALAVVVTGAAMLTRELSVCRRCGNTAELIAAQVGRWMLLSLTVSAVVHRFSPDYLFFTGVLAGALLWLGDVWTCPVILPAGKGTLRRIAAVARQSYAVELMQYLVAYFLLMLLRASQSIVDIAYAPMILLTLLLLFLYLRSMDGDGV